MMLLVLLVKVTAECFLLVKKIGPLLFSGCFLLLHGFGVALKSFPLLVPLTVHVDPGWLLPSVSLYITMFIEVLV